MKRELWTTIVSVIVLVVVGALAADAVAELPDRDEGRPAKERDGGERAEKLSDRDGGVEKGRPRDGDKQEQAAERDADGKAADREEGQAPKEGADGEKAWEAKHQFPAPYDKMAADCKLNEKQQDKLKAMIEQRDKRLEAYDKRIAHQNEFIDRQQNPEHRQAAQAALEGLREQRKRLEDQTEIQVVSTVLTSDQKGIWYGQKLEPMVTEEFRMVELNPEQREKLTEVCREVGKRVRSVEEQYAKPAVAQASSRVFRTVLDKEQKVAYAKAKREEAQREKAERSSRYRQRQQREGESLPPR